MIPTRIPHGRTARRVEWTHLPPGVRRAIEAHLGSPVEQADSQGAGFTPGFASVLTCGDGTRHFVKAASVKAQRMFAESYREEARKLGALPRTTPAPRLLWTDEVEDWFLLGIEHVAGRAPHRPWTVDDLALASTMVLTMAEVLTPAPVAGIATAAQEFAAWPGLWRQIDHPRAAEIGALAERFADVVAGHTLVHTDIRDDNILVLGDGRAVLCDWNWPVAGATWLDSLFLLIGPRGDGLDVEGHIADHPLLSAVPPQDIDTVLALVLGYFTSSANEPVPATSPYVRMAQAWQRDVIDDWLAERRGWS